VRWQAAVTSVKRRAARDLYVLVHVTEDERFHARATTS